MNKIKLNILEYRKVVDALNGLKQRYLDSLEPIYSDDLDKLVSTNDGVEGMKVFTNSKGVQMGVVKNKKEYKAELYAIDTMVELMIPLTRINKLENYYHMSIDEVVAYADSQYAIVKEFEVQDNWVLVIRMAIENKIRDLTNEYIDIEYKNKLLKEHKEILTKLI